MKIKKIREIIERLDWSRTFNTGGTREENLRLDLPAALGPAMRAAEELEIPARFAADIEWRANAIARAKQVIGRWRQNREEAQAGLDGPLYRFALTEPGDSFKVWTRHAMTRGQADRWNVVVSPLKWVEQ